MGSLSLVLPASLCLRKDGVEEPAELRLAPCSLASSVALGSPASLSGNGVVNGFQYAVSYRGLGSFTPCSFKNEAFLTKCSHIFFFNFLFEYCFSGTSIGLLNSVVLSVLADDSVALAANTTQGC